MSGIPGQSPNLREKFRQSLLFDETNAMWFSPDIDDGDCPLLETADYSGIIQVAVKRRARKRARRFEEMCFSIARLASFDPANHESPAETVHGLCENISRNINGGRPDCLLPGLSVLATTSSESQKVVSSPISQSNISSGSAKRGRASSTKTRGSASRQRRRFEVYDDEGSPWGQSQGIRTRSQSKRELVAEPTSLLSSKCDPCSTNSIGALSCEKFESPPRIGTSLLTSFAATCSSQSSQKGSSTFKHPLMLNEKASLTNEVNFESTSIAVNGTPLNLDAGLSMACSSIETVTSLHLAEPAVTHFSNGARIPLSLFEVNPNGIVSVSKTSTVKAGVQPDDLDQSHLASSVVKLPQRTIDSIPTLPVDNSSKIPLSLFETAKKSQIRVSRSALEKANRSIMEDPAAESLMRYSTLSRNLPDTESVAGPISTAYGESTIRGPHDQNENHLHGRLTKEVSDTLRKPDEAGQQVSEIKKDGSAVTLSLFSTASKRAISVSARTLEAAKQRTEQIEPAVMQILDQDSKSGVQAPIWDNGGVRLKFSAEVLEGTKQKLAEEEKGIIESSRPVARGSGSSFTHPLSKSTQMAAPATSAPRRKGFTAPRPVVRTSQAKSTPTNFPERLAQPSTFRKDDTHVDHQLSAALVADSVEVISPPQHQRRETAEERSNLRKERLRSRLNRRRTFLRVPLETIIMCPAVGEVVKSITARNAVLVSFADEHGQMVELPRLCGSPCTLTLDYLVGAVLDRVGSSLAAQKRKSVSLEWIANHFRWVISDLASMERVSLGRSDRKLVLGQVVQRLCTRADREFCQMKLSPLSRILSGDAAVNQSLVLFVSQVIVPHNVKDGSCVVEMSDSWYAVECVFDQTLAERMRRGVIKLGQKLLLSGCQFDVDPSQTGLTKPLDLNCNRVLTSTGVGIRQPRLLVGSNNAKPIGWDFPLGFVAFKKAPLGVVYPSCASKRLSEVVPGGGTVPRCEVVIFRRSLVLFREETQDGQFVIRTEQEEEMARSHHEHMMREIAASGDLPKERKVTAVVRMLVRDLRDDAKGNRVQSAPRQTHLVVVYKPSIELVQRLTEGTICIVTNLGVSKAGLAGETRFFTNNATRWVFPPSLWVMSNVNGELVSRLAPPRRFQPFMTLQDEKFEPECSIDTCLALVYNNANSSVVFGLSLIDIALASFSPSHLVAINVGNTRARDSLPLVAGDGSSIAIVAARDLAISSFDSRNTVINALASDSTAFYVLGHGSTSSSRTTRDAFVHLDAALKATSNILLHENHAGILTWARKKALALVGGTYIPDEPPSICTNAGLESKLFDAEHSTPADSRPPLVCSSMDTLTTLPACVVDEKSLSLDSNDHGSMQAPLAHIQSLPQREQSPSDEIASCVMPQSALQTPAVLHAPPRQQPQSTPRVPVFNLALPSPALITQQDPIQRFDSGMTLTPGVSNFNSGRARNMQPTDLTAPTLHGQRSSSPVAASGSASQRPGNRFGSREQPFKMSMSSEALSYLMVGRKTIEARLNRGVFQQVRPGWIMRIEAGPQFQEVEVITVRVYTSFTKLVETEPIDQLAPWCSGAPSRALDELNAKFGAQDAPNSVVAFELRCLDSFQTSPVPKYQG